MFIKKLIRNQIANAFVLLGFIQLWIRAKCSMLRHPQYQHWFILDIPEHGNLGDHAIAIATRDYLQHVLGNENLIVFEVSHKISRTMLVSLKKLIESRPILILGGGNIGTLYMHHEVLFREIATTFSDNRIIFFPQTVYYEDSEYGRKQLEITRQIFSQHKDLYVFVREEISYHYFSEHFPNVYVSLVPDMVLMMNRKPTTFKRDGALLCMRADKESIFSVQTKQLIEGVLRQEVGAVSHTDTVVPRRVGIRQRKEIVNSKLDEFRCAELVVTDRLHGMVFAYLTKSPCIVFDNVSRKVKGVYKWIKDASFITFVENAEISVDVFRKVTQELIDQSQKRPMVIKLDVEFEPLTDLLRETLKISSNK